MLAAINAASPYLPPNLPYPPTIRKVNPADTPVLILALSSETLPLTTIDAYAEKHPAAQDLANHRRRTGHAWRTTKGRPFASRSIRRRWLRAALSLEDVRNVISGANVDLPKGTLNSPRQLYTLNTNDQLLKPEAYNDLIIAYRNGAAGAHPRRRPGHRGLREQPLGRLARQGPRHHPGGVSRARRQCDRNGRQREESAAQLKASIPPAIKVSIASDRTDTIRASVADVVLR